MFKWSRLLGASASAAVLVSIAACGGGAGSDSKVAEGGTMTMIIESDPGSLDPQRTLASLNILTSVFAYDTPVTLDAKNHVVPGIVTKWTAGDNSYLLTVRKDVTCSDGSPLGASTVAANINYVGDPKNKSPFAGAAVPTGAKAVADNGAGTVKVSLPGPSAFFVDNLRYLSLVCDKGLADRGGLAKATVGSGPYVLSKSSPNNSYTYKLRKGYTWGPKGARTDAKGLPKTVVLKLVINETTAANLLLSGDANVATVTGADRARLKGAGLFQRTYKAIAGEMMFNQAKGQPGADVRVRRALTMALDLKKLAKVYTEGAGQLSTGLMPAPRVCVDDTSVNLPAHDLEMAKTVLDDAGWTVGAKGGVRSKDGKPLNMSLLFGDDRSAVSAAAEVAAAQWKKLGVGVKLRKMPEDQADATLLGGGAWDVAWEPIKVANPETLVPLLSGPVPPDGSNFGHIDNAAYTNAMEKARKQPGTEGCADWTKAESALLKDADVVPFADASMPTWGKNVTFGQLGGGVISPTSVRMQAK